MDRDPAPSAAEQVKASVKEAIDKLTSDTKARVEGHPEKTEIEVQSTAASAGGEPENVTRK